MKIFFQKNLLSAAVAVLTVFCAVSAATTIQARVDELIKTRKYDTGGLSVVFVDLDNDSVVVSVNADAMMNPASVQKLVTGAAAFELLGPTYVFPTRVYIDGEFQADSGIVRGNLYIRGSGDPGLNAEKIWLFVQHLHHRGIRRVTGDLILDNFYFDNVGVGPGFSENESRSYQSLIGALVPNYSSVAIHHRPAHDVGSPVHIDLFPRNDGFRINSTATTVEGKKGKLEVSTSLNRGVTQINVSGTMGIEERPGYTYRRIWQTWDAFGGAFRAQCVASGINIQGKTIRRRVPDTLTTKDPFYTFGSEPITEFVKHSFKWSSNFVTEMLFKTMGARRRGEPGTWTKGSIAALEWWTSRGLPGKPHIINGSGMGVLIARQRRVTPQSQPSAEPQQIDSEDEFDESDDAALIAPLTPGAAGRIENLISANQMTALLVYVSKQKTYFPDFLAALPVSGMDGTLRSRFQRSRLRGVVRAKTGSLNSLRVSALAGYLLLDDKTYAFTIFCNNVGPSSSDNWIMQEQILETVALVRNRW